MRHKLNAEVRKLEAKFCMACGHELESRNIDGTMRMACTSCSFIHWGNYSIGVGALVVKEDKILLVRRAQEPGKGKWTNPGGYIEQLEAIQDTVQREVMEECGVQAIVKNVVALRDQPRSIHNLYVAFEMEYVSGEPAPDNVEVDAAGFFTLQELESMDVASFTQWLVDVAFHGRSQGLRVDSEPVVPLNGYGLFRT